MKSLNVSVTIAAALLALGAVGACSSKVTQGGSETNWVCSTDGDCPSAQACVDKKCEAKSDGSMAIRGVDAGVGGSAGGGGVGGSMSGAGGTGSPGVPTQTTTTFIDTIKAQGCTGTDCLTGQCLPRKLVPDAQTHEVPCQVLDATVSPNGCNCLEPGHAPAADALKPHALDLLRQGGTCDAAGAPACTDMCLCELVEMSGSNLQSCLSDPTLASGAAGWCYVDPASEPDANPMLVEKCAPNEQRIIRIGALPSGSRILVLECSTSQTGTAAPVPNPGQIGDPCIPGDEYRPTFAGFGVGEVDIETGTPQCETGMCLAANFQGRVTCPYGQTDPAQPSCFTPDGAPVTVEVPEQLVQRQASKTVYCSCRCDGPDPSATYCACPTGFDCAPLVPDIGLGQGQLAGSFCVKTGTEIPDPKNPGGPCISPNCGPANP